MRLNLIFFIIVLSLNSCQNETSKVNNRLTEKKTEEISTQKLIKPNSNSSFKKQIRSSDLVDILELNPTIQVDLKYATTDNFMHQRLYFNIDKLYLQRDVAERLSKVQNYLKQLHPSYSLLVYDGVRPLSVQQKMWDALDSIPVAQRTKFVSNPANGSIHNYGAAVDLTICDENGKALDMGAGYDDIREIAYPSKEAFFLANGELSLVQIANRKLLRKVMQSQGFRNIPTEWWHFNACSRNEAKIKYELIK
jgi:zinc D-Ala-D-Ala dipeptidase